MSLVICSLVQKDAHKLAPLVAAYAQAMKRGAPRRPDEYYSELLLEDGTAEVLGAYVDDALVGFAVYFELPDTMSGHRVGHLEDIYVLPEFRNRGIGRKFVETLKVEGQSRGWDHLRWVIPPAVDAAATGLPADSALYDEIAIQSAYRLYDVIIDPLSVRRYKD